MVSPGVTEKIINAMIESEIPFLPGISNVSQIMLANQYKCETLKFFPAIISGGINTLNQYNKLFPNIMFCPTGGVSSINFRGFLELKNVISVAGSWLIKK
jgi:2-dehydro-3-deoxyphosphogluconate aldolase/(4S)-4-hydroxy-2-oxoglutarate aldolase